MICNKCKKENTDSSKFCRDCGNPLVKEAINNSSSNTKKENQISAENNLSSRNKKNNDGKIVVITILIVIALAIIGIVFAVSLIIKSVKNLITISNKEPTQIEEKAESKSLVTVLKDDFESGEITADQYIMQYAYSIYDKDKLDTKYSNYKNSFDSYSQLFEVANENADKLSDDTIKYLYDKYYLNWVEWNIDVDSSVEGTSGNDSNTNIVPMVSKDRDVSKLDEVIFSSNENFLIFYTKSGKNSISEENALEIANYLEEVVNNYKKSYGLDFKYESVAAFNNTKAWNLLKENNIPIEKMYDAMPVYIVDIEDSGSLGFYTKPLTYWEELALRFTYVNDSAHLSSMKTTYSYPFFVVNSSCDNMDDVKIVAAHELFHHYQSYICNEEGCASGFIVEATANLASAQNSGINRTGTAINVHAYGYIKEYSNSIDKIGENENALGYGSYTFLQNYSEVVDNGTNIILNSLKEENTLQYLYNNSNNKFKDVMVSLATKNLTDDYDNKLYLAHDGVTQYYPIGEDELCTDQCVKNSSVDYASMHYYYFEPLQYDNDSQLVIDAFNDSSATLLIFTKNNHTFNYSSDVDKYNLLHQYELINGKFIVDINDFSDYDVVAFAIVNSAINSDLDYEIEITEEEKYEVTEKFKEEISGDLPNAKKIICKDSEESDFISTDTTVNISYDSHDKIDTVSIKGDFTLSSSLDSDSFGFKLGTFLINIMVKMQEKDLSDKNIKIETNNTSHKYEIEFSTDKDGFELLTKNFDLVENSKESIVNAIEEEGFTCTVK